MPSARDGHTMVVLNDKIYIFGGIGNSNSKKNDLYEIDIAYNISTQINDNFTETLPTARIGHTMVTMNNKIYIFGGDTSSDVSENPENDFHEIDVTTSNTRLLNKVNYDTTLLIESFEHTMVVLNDKIYICLLYTSDAADE